MGKSMESMAQICCENCHAVIAADSPKCPYCGAINALGSEKQYMEHLTDIRQDVEKLQQIPVRAYRKEIRKNVKMICITLLILIIIAGIIGGFYFCFQKFFSYGATGGNSKQQLLWEKENYPKLDELYEAGDYDGILAFLDEAGDEEGYSVYNWEHYDFIEVYRFYENCMYTADVIRKETYKEEDIKWCIVDALFVLREVSYASYTTQEEKMIDGYRNEVCEMLEQQFGMTQEEIDNLYQNSLVEEEYGIVFDYRKAQKNAKLIAEEYMKQH
ncbi:MAG: hypothetical protein PUD93_06100 [Lachnospiraceae bacterium]|nr:hypothetical protein [Lachnospiraceae bacterium]